MFALELIFDDDDRRLAGRPAHRERLVQLQAAGQLMASGPWEDESGALLIFRVDKAGMDEILAADPYYHGPGVTVASVREWNPIAGDAI
jgi:hypothetical protein